MRKIVSIVLTLASFPLYAQTELPTGQIEVVKDFEARLTETNKIRIVPQPIPVDSNVRRYEYKLLAPSPAIDYLIPEIKPLAISQEKKPAYFPLYVKAGYGSPNSLLGMFSYDHVQNESFQWGTDFNLLSANNKKIPLQKFSDGRGQINATYLLNETIQLDGYIDGHFEKVYFYGADPIPANAESLKRTFNRYDAHFTLAKLFSPDTRFRYNAFFQYFADKDNLGSRENSLRIGGDLGSSIGASEYPIGIKVTADLSKLTHTVEHNLNNLLVEPHLEYFTGDFKLHLGGIALLRENQNELLPGIEMSYGLFQNKVSLHAGWQGDVAKNNFHFLSSYNPYINTRLDSINNQLSRRLFAGVSGITGNLSYEFNAAYTTFEGMAFFLQDEDEEEQFNPIYDNGSYFGIEGSVRYEVLKHVILRTQIYQRFYTLDTESKPWHRPSFGIDGQVTYAGGGDTYHASFIFHGENGLPYRTIGGTESNLDPLIDLNIHGDYFFTESFGAFIECNNLLGNNRERWATYPSFGFNAKIGILFRLPQ